MAYWEWHVPTSRVLFSREWLRMLQSDDEAMLGPSNAKWWPLLHEDDLEPFMNAAREVVEGRSDQYQALLRFRRADGVWLWILSRGRVTEKEQGKAIRVRGTVNDVSMLRSDVKFQHGLQHTPQHGPHPENQPGSQESPLLVNAPDMIVRMDRQLSPLFHNPGIARYLSRSSEPELFAPGQSGLEQSDAAQSETDSQGAEVTPFGMPAKQFLFLRENVNRVFDTGLSARKVVTFPTAYGHSVTGEYSFWPEFDQDGNVLSALTQFRDLTDQILAERRARLNEMRLEALYHLTQMDSAPREEVLDYVMQSLIQLTGSAAGVLFFPPDCDGEAEAGFKDSEDGIVVWSRSLHALIGRDNLPHTTLPQDLLTLLACNRNTGLRRLENGNGLFPIHTALHGSLPVMRFISAPVFDRGRLACIAAVVNKGGLYYEDDLQQLEAFINSSWYLLRRHSFVRQLQAAKERAERANKIKNTFLASVSHELRTPLNGILCMLQLLEEMPLTRRQREYVQMAGASGRALVRIVSDILDYSRMEAGRLELKNESMNLGETLRSAVKILQQEAESKGLTFTLCIDDALPALVCGDHGRVRQIIINLVSNALKFTEKGSISLSCSLLPAENSSATPREARVRFCVADTGIGIPAHQQAAVFEAFTQLDNSAEKKHAGSGLGLTIVKRLVSLMGGCVRIDSTPGVGTKVECTARFTVPSSPASQESPASPDSLTAQTKPAPLPCMDILVVEDDATSRFALNIFLQKLGQRAVSVDNGQRALEILQLHPFHCLFTDILMPRMDGLELIRRIREQRYTDFPPGSEARSVLRAALPGTGKKTVQINPHIVAVSVSAHAMVGDQDRFLRQGMDYCLAKPVMLADLQATLTRIAARLFT